LNYGTFKLVFSNTVITGMGLAAIASQHKLMKLLGASEQLSTVVGIKENDDFPVLFLYFLLRSPVFLLKFCVLGSLFRVILCKYQLMPC
jgi:hypothetical protein